ncbi:hypothetical protein Rleg9DRAFT_7373 [Rhizobium leguminosarum bv. trifolii WSM597]|uniref:Uncharacterized protein n=1 Tax=Rhizobium leguminosarum bv. trifolii WSM597 TaxID=754764 RepID=J0HD10_RHILT|nr:hypothetical protein Rleg9DRAFT_1133 [Rhizobium leguminosarum bv. trifolii WSM597]EJB08325.1 hypothetical protein Rleg9DRAFT_7373 [Rhizobium leguminosarum bv. trifolii WSM597]
MIKSDNVVAIAEMAFLVGTAGLFLQGSVAPGRKFKN